ncbi:unnamed protein product, partial [Echinostoma caproni]|uniref:L27 domain-containing protein n=1 Tax=Echinostoma caproni TaxID=27848 RepID=A0A183AM91_9TREM
MGVSGMSQAQRDTRARTHTRGTYRETRKKISGFRPSTASVEQIFHLDYFPQSTNLPIRKVCLYDHINSHSLGPNFRVPDDATIKCSAVLADLVKVNNASFTAQADELGFLLKTPHMRALLQTHDVIAHEVYSAEALRVTPPPLSSFLNGDDEDEQLEAEVEPHVTRVRLVQFQKNTDEP